VSERHELTKTSEPPRARSEESTAPFLLERSSPELEKLVQRTSIARPPVLRMARRLGVLMLLNTALYAAIAGAGALRYARDRGAIPEVVLAIIALGLTVWGGLGGYHLLRASRGKTDAGHQLAGAFSNLRSIFILKGTGLFLVLALSCFAFSAVLSLFALL
jgi:hypothetical protein